MAENALVAISPKSELLVEFTKPETLEQLDLMLAGSDLNGYALLTDLAAVLTANPKVRAACTPESLFVCLHAAARSHTTFGDGGLWIIPDKDDNGPRVRPQESEKFITRAAKKEGWAISVTLVWSDQQPIEVESNEAGQVVRVDFAQGNPFADRLWGEGTKDEDKGKPYLIGAVGVAEHEEGRRLIELFSKQDIERRRDHSAAFKKNAAPSWKDDAFEMVKRSIRAAMGRMVVPIRTKAPGGVGHIAMPTAETIDVTAESEGTTLIADLESRAAASEPDHPGDDPEINEEQYTRIQVLSKEKGLAAVVKERVEKHYQVATRKKLSEAQAADLIDWMEAKPGFSQPPKEQPKGEEPAQGELT